MSDSVFAGIDLGTTFSSIAVLGEDGEPIAVPNAEGETSMPSVVHVGEDGSVLVGTPALAYATDTARIFKRFMGTSQTWLLAGRHYSPEELSAEVLRKLARDASARLGKRIQEVVITVPAYFGQLERDATRRAGELAGLTVLQMIGEPTSAASVYIHHRPLEPGHVLVFDLGGGTFDVTLLEVTEVGPYVKRTGGSIHLGGQNFTSSLMEELERRYQESHHIEMVGEARVGLDREAEHAKIALSSEPTVEVTIQAPDGPAMRTLLTRDDFEEAIDSYLMQIEAIIDLLLERAHVTPADIRKVLLVGGSSRIPAVRAMLARLFGQPPDESLNADLAVAWGAALVTADFHAEARASGEGGSLVMPSGQLRIRDSVSHAIGVKALAAGSNVFVLDAVLAHGFPLEQWSQPRHYAPERPEDRSISVEIFQGDTAEISGCKKIGVLPIPLPPGAVPDATLIQVWMRLNRSGLLEVQVAINDQQRHSAEIQL